MQQEELVAFAKSFLQENYGLMLDIPVVRNNRLRSTHGRFVIMNNQANKIDLAGYLLDYGAIEAILGVLKHECIHYALFKKGINHHDGDPAFEMELVKHQAPKTRTLNIGKYYLLKCGQCENIVSTKKKSVVNQPDQYLSACCRSKLIVVGVKIYNGSDT
jgi:SprT-like protein